MTLTSQPALSSATLSTNLFPNCLFPGPSPLSPSHLRFESSASRFLAARRTPRRFVALCSQQRNIKGESAEEGKSSHKISEARSPDSQLSGVSVAALSFALVALQALSPPLSPNVVQSQLPSFSVSPAEAVLFSPDAKLPRNGDVALRKAVPVINSSLRSAQDSLENNFQLLRIPQRKPYGTMESNVNKAKKIFSDEAENFVSLVPQSDQSKARELCSDIEQRLDLLLASIADKDADKISIRLSKALDDVAALAILQSPSLPFFLPAEFSSYARLTGRAVVEFSLLRSDGTPFLLNSGANTAGTGVVQVVVDGYSAPLTAGNFVDLVLKRAYDGVALKTSYNSAFAQSKDDSSEGGVAGRVLPLEIKSSGDFQPTYRIPLDVQEGELPVLPLSVFGSVAMTHSVESDSFNHPSQFFVYLYDKRNSGLGGISFDEGQFSVFGYVTKGKELLSQLKTGDVIQSARVISGKERLVTPSQL